MPSPTGATGTIRIHIEGEGWVNYKYTYTPPANESTGSITDTDKLNQTSLAIAEVYKKTVNGKMPDKITAYITLQKSHTKDTPHITKITIKEGSRNIEVSLDQTATRENGKTGTVRQVFEDFLIAYRAQAVARPILSPPQSTTAKRRRAFPSSLINRVSPRTKEQQQLVNACKNFLKLQPEQQSKHKIRQQKQQQISVVKRKNTLGGTSRDPDVLKDTIIPILQKMQPDNSDDTITTVYAIALAFDKALKNDPELTKQFYALDICQKTFEKLLQKYETAAEQAKKQVKHAVYTFKNGQIQFEIKDRIDPATEKMIEILGTHIESKRVSGDWTATGFILLRESLSKNLRLIFTQKWKSLLTTLQNNLQTQENPHKILQILYNYKLAPSNTKQEWIKDALKELIQSKKIISDESQKDILNNIQTDNYNAEEIFKILQQNKIVSENSLETWEVARKEDPSLQEKSQKEALQQLIQSQILITTLEEEQSLNALKQKKKPSTEAIEKAFKILKNKNLISEQTTDEWFIARMLARKQNLIEMLNQDTQYTCTAAFMGEREMQDLYIELLDFVYAPEYEQVKLQNKLKDRTVANTQNKVFNKKDKESILKICQNLRALVEKKRAWENERLKFLQHAPPVNLSTKEGRKKVLQDLTILLIEGTSTLTANSLNMRKSGQLLKIPEIRNYTELTNILTNNIAVHILSAKTKKEREELISNYTLLAKEALIAGNFGAFKIIRAGITIKEVFPEKTNLYEEDSSDGKFYRQYILSDFQENEPLLQLTNFKKIKDNTELKQIISMGTDQELQKAWNSYQDPERVTPFLGALQTQLTFFLDKNPEDFITIYERYKNKSQTAEEAFASTQKQMTNIKTGFTNIADQFINTTRRSFSVGLSTNLLFKAHEINKQMQTKRKEIQQKKKMSEKKYDTWAFYAIRPDPNDSATIIEKMAQIKEPSTIYKTDFQSAKANLDVEITQPREYWY